MRFIPFVLGVASLALVTLGVLVLAKPSVLGGVLDKLGQRDRYIAGALIVLGGVVGPIALVWCVACLKASGRRSFYYDSLLEQMIGGDSLEEHYTVEGQEHAMNGTILFIGGTEVQSCFGKHEGVEGGGWLGADCVVSFGAGSWTGSWCRTVQCGSCVVRRHRTSQRHQDLHVSIVRRVPSHQRGSAWIRVHVCGRIQVCVCVPPCVFAK